MERRKEKKICHLTLFETLKKKAGFYILPDRLRRSGLCPHRPRSWFAFHR
jgi:hypothetical protein